MGLEGRNRGAGTRLALAIMGLLLLLGAALGQARAEEPSWSGTWDTRWAGGGARLTLRQDGDRVVGSYPFYGGTIEGQVEGNHLVGTWKEARGSGPIELILSDNGNSFLGRVGRNRWATGSRVDPRNSGEALQISQATPEDTLRAFLVGGDAIRNGQLEFQDDVVSLLSFPEDTLRRNEQLKQANRFWVLLDQFFIPPEELAPQPKEGDTATIAMTRYDGHAYTVSFRKEGGRWFIAMPPAEEVAAELKQVFASHGGRAPSESEVFKLKNPRDTMEAFLDSMRAGLGGLDTAIETLNLSELSPVVRDREAALLAEYLNEVLARIGEVVLQEIPNDPNSEEPYVHFVHPQGDIVIGPVAAGDGVKWQFTPETLRTIRALYAATEGLPPGAHVLPFTAASKAPFFRIRNVLSDVLPAALAPLGPLEVWQWAALVLLALLAVLGGLLLGAVPDAVSHLRHREEAAIHSHFFLTWGLRLLAFGLVALAGHQYLGLPEHFAEAVKAVALAAMIAGAIPVQFWMVEAIRAAADRSGLVTQHGEILANLLMGIVKIAIIVGNFLLLAEALSIPYGAALAGLGIGGLAVALAARSTLENVISGFILFADRPLKVGDFCRFGSRVGTVERIGIRSTLVRTLDRTLVSVPNAEFVNMHLENFGRRDRILLHRTIALRHETTSDQLRFVLAELRKLLIAHPKVSEEPARVRLVNIGPQSLDIEIFAYVKTTDWSEFLAIAEDIQLHIREVVERAGTRFALPSQTLYVGRDGGLDAERGALAEETVAAWRQAQRLPFPNFTAEEIAQAQDTLPYPPEGAPAAFSQVADGQMATHRARRAFWAFARGGGKPKTQP